VFADGRGRLCAGGYLEMTIALSLLLNVQPRLKPQGNHRTAQASTGGFIPKRGRRRQTRPVAVRGREAPKRSGLSEKLPRFG
jgi:hypothetical protein